MSLQHLPTPRRTPAGPQTTRPTARRLTAAVTAVAVAASLTARPATPAVAQETGPGTPSAALNLMLAPGADETQLNLSWRNTPVADEYVQIAPAGEDLETAAKIPAERATNSRASQTHKATVTGLEADTEYRYRVGSDDTGWTGPFEYSTESFDDEWNFLYVGDAQLGAGDLPGDTEGWKQTVATMTGAQPDASWLLSGGDQIDQAVRAQYDAFTAPEELRSLPTATIMGNHETYGDGPLLFDQHYNNPNINGDRNYYYEHNNVLVVALDSNAGTAAARQRNIDYLRQVIPAHGADKDWVIVTYHHAPFSQAYHYYDTNVAEQREAYAPVLSELGVDVVLGGHDHIYTRSHLMEGTRDVRPAATPAPGDVLHPEAGQTLYITASSSSGSKFYDLAGPTRDERHEAMTRKEAAERGIPHDSTAWWNQDYTPDYTSVDVTGRSLTLSTRNVDDGSLVDEVTLSKDPKDPAEPGDPAAGSAGSSDSAGSSGPSAIVAGVLGGLSLVGLLGLIFSAAVDPDARAQLEARGRELAARLGLN